MKLVTTRTALRFEMIYCQIINTHLKRPIVEAKIFCLLGKEVNKNEKPATSTNWTTICSWGKGFLLVQPGKQKANDSKE
jgi:hypothetical protein